MNIYVHVATKLCTHRGLTIELPLNVNTATSQCAEQAPQKIIVRVMTVCGGLLRMQS